MKAMRLLILMLVLQNALTAFSQQYWKVSGYTESTAKYYLDSNSSSLDPIEGIWQSTEGCKYAVEKDVELFVVVFLCHQFTSPDVFATVNDKVDSILVAPKIGIEMGSG